MKVELLAENNPCGRTLLDLVAGANTTISELLRLTDFVPAVYKAENRPDLLKYADLVIDFLYFNMSDAFELKVENNPVLKDCDEELRENNLDILGRFYRMFESIHRYACDLNRLIEDVEEGFYIQQTIETVLEDSDGAQLLLLIRDWFISGGDVWNRLFRSLGEVVAVYRLNLSEALYLYGVMLLLLDRKYDGLVRERLLVAYYRYSSQSSSSDSKIDQVCKLMRSTGSTRNKRPANYPESFFNRVPINKNFVSMVIGKLRSDDIYHLLSAYPHPDHRRTALATQAAMLFVCLFFDPDTLKHQTAVMREIVDKYFSDNWVISLYMGTTLNLIEAWEPYKAAKCALANSLEASNIRLTAVRHGEEVKRLNTGLAQFLQMGPLTDEYVLDNGHKLMNTLRKCNSTLRWMMLHTAPLQPDCEGVKKCKQCIDQVVADSKFDAEELFQLLLDTSQFELKLKEKLKEMLGEREKRWSGLQCDCNSRLSELAGVFSGTTPLTRIEKNAGCSAQQFTKCEKTDNELGKYLGKRQKLMKLCVLRAPTVNLRFGKKIFLESDEIEKLQKWFEDIGVVVKELQFDDPKTTGRKLVNVIHALEEVQEYHNLETNLQIKHFLADTRGQLHVMLRILNMKDDALVQIQIIEDISYAWEIIDNDHMQQRIKRDPQLSIKLRCTFLKLASVLGMPLLRIEQAQRPDLLSVSKYYSNELVAYIRRVLQIIPSSVFHLLSKIINIQTMKLREVPTRLDKDKLKEFALLDERFEIARLTHAISVLTEGILAMKKTLVGIAQVDPKKLLEDGIRQELVQHLAYAMHRTIVFNPKAKQRELFSKLQLLAKHVDGFRRSFEYISDYISMAGLKMWQEEFSRIVNFNVEQECNVYSRHKIHEWESVYQSRAVPIPNFAPTDNGSLNFIGRLARELLLATDPKNTLYVYDLGFWFDQKTKKECVNAEIWRTLTAAISNIGLSGLDRLYGFMIVSNLDELVSLYKRDVEKSNDWLQLAASSAAVKAMSSGSGIIAQAPKTYSAVVARCGKSLTAISDWLLKIGQLQVLRLHIMHHMNTCCKFESTLLEHALQTLNRSLMIDIRLHMKDSSKPCPKDDNLLLYELTSYLEASGITDVFAKVYQMFPCVDGFALYIAMLVISFVPKLVYVRSTGLVPKKADTLDAFILMIGTVTLWKQFPATERKLFLQVLGQYAISMFQSLANPSVKPFEMPVEVVTVITFLKEFLHFSGVQNLRVDDYIPKLMLDAYLACTVQT